MTPGDADGLWELLRGQVDQVSLRWLEDAVDNVRQDRSALAKLFPAVGRHIGRQQLGLPQERTSSEHDWTVDDAGRVLLLLAVGDDAWRELDDLYRFGDATERRAVLRSLQFLAPAAADADAGDTKASTDTGDAEADATKANDVGLRLVDDAIRTNDPRLIAAGLNPYALERLDEDAFNQAVLKCVFVGVPLGVLAGTSGLGGPGDGSLERIAARATSSLSRMLAGYIRERVAAGRDVPADVWPLIEAHPPDDVLAAIEAEREHPVEARREAARAALAQRAEHVK